jgi:plasmid stabilization system protein ParE
MGAYFSDPAGPNLRDVATEIVATARAIAKAPRRPPFVGSTFDRKWRVKRFPVLLFYRIVGDDIWILRVRHSAEDWMSEYE